MKFILVMSLFLLFSSISVKKKSVSVGISFKELCPNLGQIPQNQIPIRAVDQSEAMKNHVVIFTKTQEKLFVPIQLISNAREEIKTFKDWENFSYLYQTVCGEKPPFFPKNLLTKKTIPKQQLPSQNSITYKKAQIEGVGKVLRATEKHILLEGKVIYNQKISQASVIMEDGIFLVKGRNFKLPQNSLVSLKLKYLGQFYDSRLKVRIPVYVRTHDL